jgi:hypothetical protein
MFRFILGLIMGAVATTYFLRSEYAQQMDVDARLDEFQERANVILSESRKALADAQEQMKQVADMAKVNFERGDGEGTA